MAASSSNSCSSSSFLAPGRLIASYFCMEQALRHQNLRKAVSSDASFSFHNLFAHLHSLSLDSTYNTEIAETLYLANAWLTSTYDQEQRWRRIQRYTSRKPPEPLLEQYEIFESFQGLDKGKLEASCNRYLKGTLEFIQQFYRLPEAGVTVTESYRFPELFNLSWVNQATRYCGKYKQIGANLQVLKEVYGELNRGEISAGIVSLCIRMVVYWEGQLIQNILKEILRRQSGPNMNKEHNLLKLTDAIKWPEGACEVITPFFKKYMTQWHNVARYPFEFTEVISPLHQLVLTAEMIRNGSGTPEGYMPQEKDSITRTALDFIGMPTTDVTQEALFKGLHQFHRSCRDTFDVLMPLFLRK